MFAHAYGYASCLWESFYSREWESIPWSTSRQPSLWPTGTACPLHMVFPSPGRATAGTEQQGTRSCPGSGSQRIHSKTLLQETKSESIASINHICVLLIPWMPNPDMFFTDLLKMHTNWTQLIPHCVVTARVKHHKGDHLSLWVTTGSLVESIWFT